jgi:hypothetical protein
MKTQSQHNSIQEKILQKVRDGSIKQKPKWQFVLRTVLLVSIITAVFLVTLYLAVYTTLVTQEHELFRVFDIGPRATFMFLGAVPWLIIAVLGIAFLSLQSLVRHFAFAYKTPVVYTLVGTFAITLSMAYGLHSLDSKARFARFGEHGEVPFMKEFHNRYLDGRQGDIVHGVLIQVDGLEYTLESRRSSSTFMFMLSSSTDRIDDYDDNDIDVGDQVFVVVSKNKNNYEAIAIKREGHRSPGSDGRMPTPMHIPRDMAPLGRPPLP